MRTITDNHTELFARLLFEEEKSAATIEKYLRDVRRFQAFTKSKPFDKHTVLKYKAYLTENYSKASTNSMLSSLNGFFIRLEWFELRVKTLKIQRRIFLSDEKELTKGEYKRLVLTARSHNNARLCLIMQTLCSTGIRISELRFITTEAIASEMAEISSKGKLRTVFLPSALCAALCEYAQAQNIKSGPVFISKNGNPLDRSNICTDMKKLCHDAGVSEKKVHPHSLRHLFARTYYTAQKDIVRLADILGHSSVNTTRIYTMESGEIHKKQIQDLDLL